MPGCSPQFWITALLNLAAVTKEHLLAGNEELAG